MKLKKREIFGMPRKATVGNETRRRQFAKKNFISHNVVKTGAGVQ